MFDSATDRMGEPSTRSQSARPAEPDAPTAPVAPAPAAAEVALLDQDLLVEDVSIDGMCGVY